MDYSQLVQMAMADQDAQAAGGDEIQLRRAMEAAKAQGGGSNPGQYPIGGSYNPYAQGLQADPQNLAGRGRLEPGAQQTIDRVLMDELSRTKPKGTSTSFYREPTKKMGPGAILKGMGGR